MAASIVTVKKVLSGFVTTEKADFFDRKEYNRTVCSGSVYCSLHCSNRYPNIQKNMYAALTDISYFFLLCSMIYCSRTQRRKVS